MKANHTKKAFQVIKAMTNKRGKAKRTLLKPDKTPYKTMREVTTAFEMFYSKLFKKTDACISFDQRGNNYPKPKLTTEIPTEEEMIKAISKIKNHKAAGLDKLTAEMNKNSPKAEKHMINQMTSFWKNNEIYPKLTKRDSVVSKSILLKKSHLKFNLP